MAIQGSGVLTLRRELGTKQFGLEVGRLINARLICPPSLNPSTLPTQASCRPHRPSRYGRQGRIPGSINVPAATLYDPATKTFANAADAERQFVAQGVTKEKQVIAYCGGGISATIDLLLLRRLGYENLMLYDGSMGEWARDVSLPIETD